MPLGLSLEQGRSLSRLVQSEEWAAYQATLQSRFSTLAESLLVCEDFATYQKVVGGLRAYEEMATLPDLVIAKLEELRGRTESAASNAATAADEYRAHRYGSRLWDEPVDRPGNGSRMG